MDDARIGRSHSNDQDLRAQQGHAERLQPYTGKRPKTAVQAAICAFSPIWYTICMNSGIIGILLSRLPYQFPHIQALASAFFVADFVFFAIFSAIIALRLLLFPGSVLHKATNDFDELCMWAAPPIAWLTIAALIGTQISPTHWGGYSWAIVAYVFWWIGVAWIIGIGVTIFVVIIKTGMVHDRSLSSALFLPCVGTATAGSTGGLIAAYSSGLSARLTVPMVIVGWHLAGYGILLSLIVYVMFTHRLLSTGFPSPEMLPGLTLLTSGALMINSYAAYAGNDFAEYARGSFIEFMSAGSVSATTTLLSFMMLGFAYFWACIIIYALIEGAVKRQLSYSMLWWSTIFPVGTVVLAWFSLATDLSSVTFRVLTAAGLGYLVVDYFINFGFTLWHTIFGRLLFTKTTQELRQEQRDEEKRVD